MNSNYIIWPVLVQIFLTLMIYILLGIKKAKAVKTGQVNRQQTALDNKAWPKDVVKISNNIANQFEVPVLFYVLSLILYSLNNIGMFDIILAWSFVLTRIAHAHVHIGSNYVPTRFKLFLIGCLILIAMLISIAWKMVT